MASMSLDPSSALAEKYKGNRQILEQAVLGRSAEPIDPYSALRALQKLNVADRYEMMQKAMQGQPNPPSIAEQTVAQAAQAQAPQGGGLAAMPVPEDSFNMAGGGLVAFADGGSTSYRELISDMEYGGLTPEERQAEIDKYQADIAAISKPEEFYGKRAEQIEDMREMGPQEMEQQKGLAALQAAAAMAQGSDFTRGLGGALGAFGESYGKAVDAANKEKRALMEMQMNMEAAQRQEAVGNYKDARAAADEADKSAKLAKEFELKKAQYLLQDEQERAKINASGAAPNYNVQAAMAFAQQYARKHPEASSAEAMDYGWRTALGFRAGISGAVRSRADAEKAFSELRTMSPKEYKKRLTTEFGGDAKAFKEAFITDYTQGSSPEALYYPEARPTVPRGGYDTLPEEYEVQPR